MSGRLTVAKVRSAKAVGRYADGHGLYLRIAPGGSRGWIQRVTINGKRCDLGLGGFPVVTLAEARDQALDNLRTIRRGGDPRAERKRSTAPTFAQAADKALAALRPGWRGQHTERIWQIAMRQYALPAIGARRVDQIGRDDLVRLLAPVMRDKPAMGSKVRIKVGQVLSWAQAAGHVEHNLIDAIGAALPKPGNGGHHDALPYQDVPAALRKIETCEAPETAKACLQFVLLTACRSGEARGATWAEIDTEAREWRVPASRMKGGAEHRVPASAAALAVLDAVRPLRRSGDLLFPSLRRTGRPIADSALRSVLAAAGLRTTAHGLRSSFRDWCADTGQPRELAEAALAHTIGGTEGAYFRSDLYDRRRRLMTDWAEYATDGK